MNAFHGHDWEMTMETQAFLVSWEKDNIWIDFVTLLM